MKIIYIISFPPAYLYQESLPPDHSWINDKDEQIGIWRSDWGHIFAENVKRFFPKVDFEVWRPDYRVEKEYLYVFEDGVVHRSFPAQKVTFWRGLKPEKYYISKELILKLSQFIIIHKHTKDLVVHIPLDFSYLTHIILKKFNRLVPFLHTSHLNPELLNVDLKTANPLSYLHRFFIKLTYNKHKKMLKEIAVSKDRTDFFERYTNANIYHLDFLNFDFGWADNKTSKGYARRKLNLPTDKKIIFSSSRLVPEKQVK